MPVSMSEHSDFLWFLLIVCVSVLGNGFVVVLVWTAKTALGRVNEKLVELYTKQTNIENKLEEGLIRVHNRVDVVKSEVDMLKGANVVLQHLDSLLTKKGE